MRILVTGGAGFIGSTVADALADRGHDVVLLDAFLPQAHGTVPRSRHRLVRGDVRDSDAVTGLLDGVDVVCHQAAMVGHGVDPSDMPDYASHNDHGTAVLLAAMHASGVHRLVLASSMVVYGEGRYRCPQHSLVRPAPRRGDDLAAGQYEPRCPICQDALQPELVPEDALLDPRSTYAATKLAQEHLATAWARQTGGGVWALRYHNVYGPWMPSGTPYAGVASLFRSALHDGRAPVVLEDGHQRRDFVHVSDVAAANLAAVEAEPPPGELDALNICSGTPHTIGELAGELARACGGPAPRVVGGARPGDVRHIVADPAKATRVLGFRAAVDFTTGVEEFAHAPLRESAALGGGQR
ncbi:NAD-dependent epimerase/dehydratase family protein [Saccharopolyspora sp. 5N708]|uniref:NAD-dependent epimerase/dehydratase family protein n=1 Tax=Saccharopolyspora sp. 5N708 TaxID=3457424 RepID=UPI003FCFA19E